MLVFVNNCRYAGLDFALSARVTAVVLSNRLGVPVCWVPCGTFVEANTGRLTRKLFVIVVRCSCFGKLMSEELVLMNKGSLKIQNERIGFPMFGIRLAIKYTINAGFVMVSLFCLYNEVLAAWNRRNGGTYTCNK